MRILKSKLQRGRVGQQVSRVNEGVFQKWIRVFRQRLPDCWNCLLTATVGQCLGGCEADMRLAMLEQFGECGRRVAIPTYPKCPRRRSNDFRSLIAEDPSQWWECCVFGDR